jgi:hypothetical protein
MSVRMRKQLEAHDGSYGGAVLAAFDREVSVQNVRYGGGMTVREFDDVIIFEAFKLAFQYCHDFICTDSFGVCGKDKVQWFDLSEGPAVGAPPEVAVEIERCVSWLELVGCIKRHRDQPNLIRIVPLDLKLFASRSKSRMRL